MKKGFIVKGNYEVKYRCAQCGAEDTDKRFAHESPLPVINCWKCKAGFRILDLSEQMGTKMGMFPVQLPQ